MVARWEAGTKKPAPRGAGTFVFPLKNRSAEQRPHPDTRVDPAFVDHLDRDIDDHGEADVGDPAVALDILGDDVRRETHQGDGKDQPDDQYARVLARRARDRQHIVEAHADVRDGRSEEHTSELQSLMRISYAVLCLKKKTPE